MVKYLCNHWPWYVAGPLIGLTVPALLIFSNKKFGISSSLQHICAAIIPWKIDYFKYNWKTTGLWNIIFVIGIMLGGFIGSGFFVMVISLLSALLGAWVYGYLKAKLPH